jgi:UDP-glucose 4-epimerase
MSKRILVAGGAGYIGSHVVKALRQVGYTPVVFDDFSTGRRKMCRRSWDDRRRHQNYADIAAALSGAEAIIYLAAYKAAGESMTNPEKYASNNIGGAINVLNAMCEAGVGKIFFLQRGGLRRSAIFADR